MLFGGYNKVILKNESDSSPQKEYSTVATMILSRTVPEEVLDKIVAMFCHCSTLGSCWVDAIGCGGWHLGAQSLSPVATSSRHLH